MKLQLRAGTNFHEIIVCLVCIGWSARAMVTGLRHEGARAWHSWKPIRTTRSVQESNYFNLV